MHSSGGPSCFNLVVAGSTKIAKTKVDSPYELRWRLAQHKCEDVTLYRHIPPYVYMQSIKTHTVIRSFWTVYVCLTLDFDSHVGLGRGACSVFLNYVVLALYHARNLSMHC